MISHIRGTLLSSSPACVVDVGGVGLELQIIERDRSLLSPAPGEVSFFTYMYVREDRIVLFGFLQQTDRQLFMRLINVSGIGPRIALGIMAEHPAGRIVSAVRGGDHAFLRTLPGLGKKTAERLVMELKDKLEDVDVEPTPGEPLPALRDEAILALTSLGMPRQTAQRVLEKMDWSTADTANLESIIKEALRQTSDV